MKVGFVGPGNVGGKLSVSLLCNGVYLTMHDLNAALAEDFVKHGAKAAKGPAQLMRDCDAVIGGSKRRPGFPLKMVGDEPEEPGCEVILQGVHLRAAAE